MSNKHGSSWIRKEKRLAIYLRDNFHCLYCDKDLRFAMPSTVTLDHIIPRADSGNNNQENLITTCVSCNSSRQDTDIFEYLLKIEPDYEVAADMARRRFDRIDAQIRLPINLALAKAIIAGDDSPVEELR